jgi:hypothetical protein
MVSEGNGPEAILEKKYTNSQEGKPKNASKLPPGPGERSSPFPNAWPPWLKNERNTE